MFLGPKTRFSLADLGKRFVPTGFQLRGDQTVFRIHRVILPVSAISLKPRPFQGHLKCASLVRFFISIAFKKLKRCFNADWLTSFQHHTHHRLIHSNSPKGKTRWLSLLFISTGTIVPWSAAVYSSVTDMELVTATGTSQQASQ